MHATTFLGLSPAGFHRIACTEHGEEGGAPVVCVHGLTRNGRDFDKLGAALAADGRHVLCPDIVGRGQSDWLPRPELYTYPQYLADMTVVLGRFNGAPVDWIGTSMGGLIGLMLAAQPHAPIRRLVLNDIGPFIPKSALERLAAYVGTDPHVATLAELEHYLRRIHAPFGITQDDDWAALARHSARPLPEGGYALAYDPAIGNALRTSPPTDLDLWAIWDTVPCPVLLLRGEHSDLLAPETADRMIRTGPRAVLHTVPHCGHAPALMDAETINRIRTFLTE